MIPPMPRVMDWSPAEDSPVLGRPLCRPGRGRPRPIIRQRARRILLPACRWANRSSGKSPPPIKLRAPSISSASKPKPRNSFARSRSPAAADATAAYGLAVRIVLDFMLEKLKQLWRSNYLRLLEEEVSRLRAENRALMNSLLGTAGFPPVEFPEAPKPQPLPRLRKRSWHQVQAWRETEANRDATSSLDEKTFERTNGPVPHS